MEAVDLDTFVGAPELQQRAGALLRDDDGLICFPCAGTYRLCASLLSERGVMQLLQSKRRSAHRPALVMVDGPAMLEQVVGPVPDGARRLIDALWPGKLTLRLPLRAELPRKVYRELARKDGKVGVRLPAGRTAGQLVQAAGVPLLVSSANLSSKRGAGSAALIRKQFGRTVSLFIDAGDLSPEPPSTVVDFDDAGVLQLVRAGDISEERVRQAAAG